MADQVAIITGAGGGIGRAIAIELSRRGYDLVLVGRTEQTLRETQVLVEKSTPSPGTSGEGGGEGSLSTGDVTHCSEEPSPNPLPEYRARETKESLLVLADVSQPESADLIVSRAIAKFGRIDALVNNAGTAPVLTIEQTTPQIWREVIDTNLSAAFYLCRAAWPVFRKQQAGVVVNISSMAAKDPFPGFAAYGAAKAGLNNLGITLAREGEPIGVRVYTIAPGAVETPMLRRILSKDQFPEDQTLTPADVACVVAECVSGERQMDGGQVIWLSESK